MLTGDGWYVLDGGIAAALREIVVVTGVPEADLLTWNHETLEDGARSHGYLTFAASWQTVWPGTRLRLTAPVA